jgi:tRNA A-37 threonylcarbamoyl transferase component Bud32
MQALNHLAYLALREGAQVIEADGSGDKVLILTDGSMLKFFRRKRLISSALVFPYAKRFADNAQALRQRHIPCPEVLAVYRIPSIMRDAVHYQPLPGQTVRQLFSDSSASGLRRELGSFIAGLHAKGVYFRSLHLGNVVVTPEQQIGLIDIADMTCQRRALSMSKRLRNFQHMLRYTKDVQWLVTGGAQAFLDGYEAEMDSTTNSQPIMPRLRALLS